MSSSVRARERPLPVTLLVAALIGLLLAGCGSAAPAPRALSLTVTVPVNGITVKVPRIEVLGTIAPARGAVRVGGRRVRVRRGGFRAGIHLHRGLNRIRIIAAEPGLGRTRSTVTVVFHPGRAAPGPSLVDQVNGVCANLLGQTIALPSLGSPAAARRDLHSLVVLNQSVLNRLEAIHAPAATAAAYEGFLAGRRQLVADIVAIDQAIRDRSVAIFRRSMLALPPLAARQQSLANQMDFTQCTNGAIPSGA